MKKLSFAAVVFLILFLPRNSFSQVQCLVTNGGESILRVTDFIEENMSISTSEEKMGDYLVDNACPTRRSTPTKNPAPYNVCLDGSISYVQPDSNPMFTIPILNREIASTYNGFCGQTAAANVMYMHCRVFANPETYVDDNINDSTPGTRSGTLASGLNDMYNKWPENCPRGSWRHHTGANSPEEYIGFISRGLNRTGGSFRRRREDGSRVRRSPVPIMIQIPNSPKALHWVTVVDVQGFQPNRRLANQDNCMVTINHWNKQFDVPCHRLATWARNTGNGAVGAAVGSYPRAYFYPE